VLAHALYLGIHGGKNKNDRIDSEKISNLLAHQPHPARLRLSAATALPGAFAPTPPLRVAALRTAGPAFSPSTGLQPSDAPRPRSNRDAGRKLLTQKITHPPARPSKDLALIRHYDTQITALEAQLQSSPRPRPLAITLLQTVRALANIWA